MSRQERVREVFVGAARLIGADRERYLDEACGGDADLRRQVLALLSLDETRAADDTAPVSRPAAPSGGLALGGIVDEKYRIDAVLGEGGMGTVYRGFQLALERPVALKVIRSALVEMPELVERLRREALAIARLRHPNVVAVYDFCMSPEAGAYLVMELVDGESLGDALRREGSFGLSATVAVVRQICDAVQAAHDVGVVHRDLKPPNILLEPAGATSPRVKVVDFGIAKLIQGEESAMLSTDGGLIGTPLYISPEQATGAPIDARTDVYALGCILYELVTGRPPFTGSSVGRILVDHTSRKPVPPSSRASGVPAWLDLVVMRALEKRPADRFASAADLAAALVAGHREASVDRLARSSRSGSSAPAPLTVPNNLPVPGTSFVGRERELADVVDAIETSRLVTLVGPPGVGKTRLAVRAASELVARTHADDAGELPPDECWFVDLAPVEARDAVTRAVATALGVRVESDESAATEVAARLGRGRPLLVLDNAEHVAQATSRLVAELVATCPDLRIVVTSRVALHAHDEVIRPVQALAVPDPSAPASATVANESVALFVERAQAVAAGFRPAGDALEVVADLCRQLDGLPLAIELAAARARVLTPHQIRDRLRDRMRLLGSRSAAGRHESLRSAFDWSYEMLGPDEQHLFDRLSVFIGGFSIDAIESVCTGGGVDALDALDLLASLVDKSLVVVAHDGREARYRLLASFRDYAHEKLETRGEVEAMRRRHFVAMLELAQTSVGKLRTREGIEWNARMAADLDNLRAAYAWSRAADGQAVDQLRLASAMHLFFYEHGYLGEARTWLDEGIDRAGAEAPALLRAQAFNAAGIVAHDQGDLAAARAYHERALELTRETGDASSVASGLHNIGNILLLLGDFDGAEAHFAESHAICQKLGQPHNVALSLFTQGTVALERGDWATADIRFSECGALYESIDYGYGLSLLRTAEAYEALVRGNLDRLDRLLVEALERSLSVENRHNVATVSLYRARAAWYGGRLDEAEREGDTALDAFRALGDKDCAAAALYTLARVARSREARDVAARRLGESTSIRARLGMRKGIAECLEEVAALGASTDAAISARLLGAAEGVRREIGAPVYPVDVESRASERAEIRAALGETFDATLAEGSALSLEDAVALARRVTHS